MKNVFTALLAAAFFLAMPLASDAKSRHANVAVAALVQDSTSIPRPSPLAALAQVDPKFQFPDRTKAPETPTVTVQNPAAGPVVVAQVPAETSTAGWVQTGFMGILTLLFGKLALFPKATAGAVAPLDGGKVGEIVKAVLHGSGASAIADPGLRDAVDLALLRAVQSGLPGTALQTGLSLIPGAGPIVGQVEPLVRNLVTKVLQERVGAAGLAAGDPAGAGAVGTVLDVLAKLVAQHKPAAPAA